MVAATPESLNKFVTFCKQHIKGQEKKEAQTFLDRFFRAFGYEGALEAGASYEEAIKQGSKKGKTGFADLVCKPRVLIEMKKRGEDLSKHYSQAFDYWTRLVPDRPRYVLLCNFDEFWIFNFDIQLDTPVDVVPLEQLPERAGAFAFMECGDKTPVFRNNQVEVTERAARRMGELLLDAIKQRRKSEDKQIQMGFVTLQQFYGMDTNPFAVELARVTLMIARKIAIDNLKLTEPALPLDSLDNNIVCQDALFSEWHKADAIIGNPPFLGGKHLRIALGDEYIDRVFKRFPNVKDSIDFCAYWFRLAHEHIDEKGRVGLVATNSISQGKSRIATLDYIQKNSGYIHEAVSTQPWSGEAKVHVSIVNWSKENPKKYYLDNQVVARINSSLKSTTDVSQAVRLQANLNKCFQGVIPIGKGFIVTEQQVQKWIKIDSKNQKVLKLFSMGANLAKNINGIPARWLIDFNDMNIEEASNYRLPFEYVKATVKPERDTNRRDVRRINWWKFGENASKMRNALSTLACYFAVPEVSKWAIFIPCPHEWLSGNKTKAVASDDFYIFGILTSKIHRIWMHAQKSTLKADIAYTHNTCFETFPFPQNIDAQLIEKIRSKAGELNQYRTREMATKWCGITTLYNNFFD